MLLTPRSQCARLPSVRRLSLVLALVAAGPVLAGSSNEVLLPAPDLAHALQHDLGMDAGQVARYVDVTRNAVVVEVDPAAPGAGSGFIAASDIDAGMVRLVASAGRPEPFTNAGGDPFLIGFSWCSLGFPVTRLGQPGLVTVGHCGPLGSTASATDNSWKGVVERNVYPGSDHGWVRITQQTGSLVQAAVNHYAGGSVPVVGSQQAPVGGVICRSGARTGYRCGTVTAYNVSANYGVGQLYGLARTNACAGQGDSGGSVLTPGGQAQGMTSGGQGSQRLAVRLGQYRHPAQWPLHARAAALRWCDDHQQRRGDQPDPHLRLSQQPHPLTRPRGSAHRGERLKYSSHALCPDEPILAGRSFDIERAGLRPSHRARQLGKRDDRAAVRASRAREGVKGLVPILRPLRVV